MKNFKNEKAITLVALVITIIILLILAGITISQLSNSGIFNKAKTAKEEYQNAQDYEDAEIARLTNQIELYANGGTITAEEVAFTPSDPTWTGISNVKQALDYLYNN